MESSKTQECKVISGPVFHGNVTFHGSVYFQIEKEDNQKKEKYDQKKKNYDQTTTRDEVDINVKSSTMEKYTKHLGNRRIYQVTKSKGNVLIINNEFNGTESERKGSSYDIWKMSELWHEIGCTTTISKNLSCEEMKREVEKFLRVREFPDICVVILMSHGKSGDLIVGNENSEMKVTEIIEYIQRCEILKGKPKMIFIQMCRGTKAQGADDIDAGNLITDESTWFKKILEKVMPRGTDIDSSRDMIDSVPLSTHETGADTMIAFATQPEHVSFRSDKGSYFITAIAKVFAEHAKDMHLVELMKMVKDEVKKTVSSMPHRPEYHNCTATIEVKDTMGTKQLYFFPGCPKDD